MSIVNYLPPIRFRVLALSLALLHSCALPRAQSQTPIPAQAAAPDAKFKIAGTIISSLDRAPLARARVSIFDTKMPASTVWMITSEDGHFEFSQLSAGKYSLQGAKRGFLSAAYDQHEQYSTAIVTGPGFDPENLVLRLTPLAFLAGKVIDEAGDPVRHAHVRLFMENHRAGMNRITPMGSVMTDDQGFYEFPFLAPATYFVSVSAKPWYAVHPVSSAADGSANPANPPPQVAPSLDVAYPTTYYSGATDADAATPIAIKGGDHLQIDVHLSPVPALHLVFRVPDPQQGFNSPAFQKRVFDSTEFVQSDGVQSVSPGVFEVTGLPAGKYIVQHHDRKTGQIAQSTEVDLVKDGQELDSAPSEPTGSAKLSIKLPRGESPPKQLFIWLQDSRTRLNRPAEPTGEVVFEGLPAGKYTILVSSPAKPYSVVRSVVQGVETSGRELNITPGASLEATVFLAGGVVSVEGFVKRGEKPMAGVMVILVPKDPELHQDMFRRDQSDFDGSFVVRGVIPGTYTIVAVEDAWGFPWLQPGVLARYVQHGQNLTIGELMQGSVHLPDPIEVQPR